MSLSPSVAASLPPDIRKAIAIQVLSRSEPVSYLADQHQVSRKFVYQQEQKAQQALDESFASTLFAGGESQLTLTELLLPAVSFGGFLLESASVFPQPPPFHPLSGAGAGWEKSEGIADGSATSTLAGITGV
ncbi:MAG: hypothetical protein F6J95_024695 [Leptolyngbya sp. SIO1E4]|nr:hypothetical protein [Leptolyngbya sp. SIO1E4]